MSKEDKADLKKFLSPFSKEIQEIVFWLREFMWDLYPNCNELIYDNYNAVAFGWSPTERVSDTFGSIAVGRTSHNIHFGFYWGSKISDPEKKLIGQGNQYRYILVKSKNDFPKSYIRKLLKDAYNYSIIKSEKIEKKITGTTIVKSVSDKKRALKKSVKKNPRTKK